MNRKTAKNYRKEYEDLSNKIKGLESRIIDRAIKLCKKFPDIPILKNNTHTNTGQIIRFNITITVQLALELIQLIEEHNEKISNIVQTEIPYNKAD